MALRILSVVLLIFTALQMLPAQEQYDFTQRLYGSYVNDEMHRWEGIIEEMDRKYESNRDASLLYELCFAWYGYIGYLLNEEHNKVAKQELKEALERSEELESLYPERPDVLALRGAYVGYRIVLSKFSALYLSSKALKYINAAYESSETCYNCNSVAGSRYFYVPKLLGGSKEKAVPYYEKAVELLEQSSLKTGRSWLYINEVLMLANAYKDTGHPERACELYEQVLEYEPNAQWIRDRLYSKCQ